MFRDARPGAAAGGFAGASSLGRRGRFLVAAAFALCVLAPATASAQQGCESNQAQLSRAIGDSQVALDSAIANLNRFSAALIGPRTGPVDAEPVVSARSGLDAYLGALSDFSAQVNQVAPACGPQFAADAQTLSTLVARFQSERARADQMLVDHQALVAAGEPAMPQAQMEAVQRALLDQGFYQGGVDGRFGSGTRGAIGRWQAARGRPQTGYLTPDELSQLLQPAGAPAPSSDGQVAASELPPAPWDPGNQGTGNPPASGATGDRAGAPISDEASQICTQNVTAVGDAADQARSFREGILARLNAFRAAVRGPRVPAIDGEEASRMLTEVNSFLQPMGAFHDQAEAVVGQCGDAFNSAFEGLGGQIASLRTLEQRIRQADEAYAELVESGEPAMAADTMREVQTGLSNLGHYSGAIDAVFGTGTRSAIKAYQASVGAEQTGYLTAAQITALRRAAVAPPPAPPAPPPTTPPVAAANPPLPPIPTIPGAIPGATDAAAAASPQIADVRRVLFRELGQRAAPEPLSQLRRGDGRIGDMWWQAHDGLAGGEPQETVDQRLALFGAAYLDRGAESLTMVDAHLIVGDAFSRLGLYGDAAFHLQRAHDIWAGLGRDDRREAAVLLERLAANRLAQAVGNGSVGGARFDEVARLLADARGADDPQLEAVVVNRLADLHVAAGRQPAEGAVNAAVQTRYR